MLETWKKLLPETAVRSQSDVKDLLEDTGRSRIVGKRLFTVGDFTGFIKNPGAIFEFVNNHALTVRRLYSNESPSMKMYCRLIMAAVSVPKVSGRDGWDERVRFICTKPFVDKLQLPAGYDLEEELQKEIPAIASWALSMDKGVRNDLLKMKLNSEAHDEAEKDNDIVAQFLDEEMTAADDKGALLDIGNLYPLFNAFAKYKQQGSEMGEKVFINRFKGLLKQENTIVREKPFKLGGKSVRDSRVVKGLKLTNPSCFNGLSPGTFLYAPEYDIKPQAE